MMQAISGRTVGAEAWTAYKRAFRNFSEKVRIVQCQAANPAVARTEIEAAVLAVEKARAAYRAARDAVAEQILDSQRGTTSPAGSAPSPAHTAEVARLLWESLGQPEGTAEADWYRAEEIIRAAR